MTDCDAVLIRPTLKDLEAGEGEGEGEGESESEGESEGEGEKEKGGDGETVEAVEAGDSTVEGTAAAA